MVSSLASSTLTQERDFGGDFVSPPGISTLYEFVCYKTRFQIRVLFELIYFYFLSCGGKYPHHRTTYASLFVIRLGFGFLFYLNIFYFTFLFFFLFEFTFLEGIRRIAEPLN